MEGPKFQATSYVNPESCVSSLTAAYFSKTVHCVVDCGKGKWLCGSARTLTDRYFKSLVAEGWCLWAALSQDKSSSPQKWLLSSSPEQQTVNTFSLLPKIFFNKTVYICTIEINIKAVQVIPKSCCFLTAAVFSYECSTACFNQSTEGLPASPWCSLADVSQSEIGATARVEVITSSKKPTRWLRLVTKTESFLRGCSMQGAFESG